jgi:putative membrane protein
VSESGQSPEPAIESPLPRGGSTQLADGEWHRLHPATPLLRGGLALVAIAGILIANLRERLVEWFLPGLVGCPAGDDDCTTGDPVTYLIDEGYLLIALAAVLGVVLVIIAFFYVSWRMHTFRITAEVVEVRSGVLFRTHRKARLDRIQGVSINRPLFARIFGAAKLEVEVAGQDANVQLAYLGNLLSDGLRADILRLASGARSGDAPAAAGATGRLIDRRVAELLAPELDPSLAPPESVVRIPAGRLIGSTVLSGSAVFLVLVAAAAITIVVLGSTVASGFYWTLFTLIPMALGFGSYLVNRVIKFLRYSIAATPDGVRIGYGLLSTRNETLPPGRIHSVAVSQPLLWRPADWWTIRVNRASRGSSSDGGQQAQQSTIVLPVGSRDDAFRVLGLLLPDLVEAADADATVARRELLERGLAGRGGDADFTTSPRRAAVLRWFSWRRNGFALLPGAVLQRRGAIWRELAIVPTPRVQSVAVEQGPLERALRLAGINVHTVAGPVATRLGALDAGDAQALFRDAAVAVIAAAQADRTHRWRAEES